MSKNQVNSCRVIQGSKISHALKFQFNVKTESRLLLHVKKSLGEENTVVSVT